MSGLFLYFLGLFWDSTDTEVFLHSKHTTHKCLSIKYIKEPHNLTVMRLSKLKQPIKEIDCLLYLLVKRPLSVLQTPFDFPLRAVDLFDIPRKGQEAGAERPFANHSALLPSPSRGKGWG